MPVRKPPTRTELTATLSARLVLPDSALHWNTAISEIRDKHRTTRTIAEQWLIDLVTTGDAELIALWPAFGVILQSRRPAGDYNRLRLTDVGWSEAESMDLRFTTAGSRIPVVINRSTASCRDLFVLRRDELVRMRQRVIAERAERERQQREHDAAVLAEFRSRHGDALDVVTSVAARVPVLHEFLRDAMVRARTTDRDTSVELHGGPDILTIELYGPEIEAFAALLRPVSTLSVVSETDQS